MRLADFILGNIEPILIEWEAFARSVWPPGTEADPEELRDDAAALLRALAKDMKSAQTATQQSNKSKGHGGGSEAGGEGVQTASAVHASDRVRSGFALMTVIAEYRALRASVIRLWDESNPQPDTHDFDDRTRFNESLDQSLTDAARSFIDQINRSRQIFLGILSHDLRNSLNAVTISAQVLARTPELGAKSSARVSQILASAAVIGSHDP